MPNPEAAHVLLAYSSRFTMLISQLEKQFLASRDPEETFLRHIEDVIAQKRRGASLQRESAVVASEPFRPLLIGYTGAGNIGSDVRVVEMIRQFRVLFSRIGFDPVLTVLGNVDETGFAGVRRVPLPRYFPDFLRQQKRSYHAVIACEGSMFTSTFSDVLTGIFAGALADASAEGIPAIGYGATASTMSERLQVFVKRNCADAFVLCRSVLSEQYLREQGVQTVPGADPAWTFEPKGIDGAELLRRAGWDGREAVIAVCPIDPFWWPVEIDFGRARAMLKDERLRQNHYRSFLFHRCSPEGRNKYGVYLSALAECINAWRKRGCFPILVGMEKLDRKHCDDLQEKLGFSMPQFISGDHGMDAICAVLRSAALVVSSRFHATVLAMAGGVPAIGVSMDNRIDELFLENGLNEFVVRCDAPDLAAHLQSITERLFQMRDLVGARCAAIAAGQIRAIGEMGLRVRTYLAQHDERFSVADEGGWSTCLPPLSPRLEYLLANQTLSS